MLSLNAFGDRGRVAQWLRPYCLYRGSVPVQGCTLPLAFTKYLHKNESDIFRYVFATIGG